MRGRARWSMALADRLRPPRRNPIALPRPWPACAQSLLREGAFWLHGSGWGGDLLALPGGPRMESRWSGDRWTTTLDGQEQAGSPFAILETASLRPHPWIGALSFELACDEACLPHKGPAPRALGMAWQGVVQALHVEHGSAEIWSWAETPLAGIEDRLAQVCALARPGLGNLVPRWDEATYRHAVEAIRTEILDGGFYVANLCVPFETSWSGDEVTLALAAFHRAKAPFGAFLPLGRPTLLCLSMERVLSQEGGLLRSEPIKGTAPLSGEGPIDGAAGAAMQADPKERAEHIMIVDLVRNDLGRVAEQGSVVVTELMARRLYPTVQHLVSCVEARARAGVGLADILRSVLPGGSVTGAPKAAVCAHLASVEASTRGFYCGALGWIKGGDFDLALPIRTAQIHEDHFTYWAGGGITLRSDPSKEWDELHLKTKVLRGPGIEDPAQKLMRPRLP